MNSYSLSKENINSENKPKKSSPCLWVSYFSSCGIPSGQEILPPSRILITKEWGAIRDFVLFTVSFQFRYYFSQKYRIFEVLCWY